MLGLIDNKNMASLKGKKVFAYDGTFLGIVRSNGSLSMNVEKRALGFGPYVSKRVVPNDMIDSIEEHSIKLRPDPYDYWQIPLGPGDMSRAAV